MNSFVNHRSVGRLTATGLLIAIGIMIPMFMPIRIVIGDSASYTLASHVAIFIAMFISPWVAVLTTIGTTLGFLLAGAFPPIVVARAASHIVFVVVGAYYLKKIDKDNIGIVHLRVLSLVLGVIHAMFEVFAVLGFHFFAGTPINNEVFTFTLLFVGLGTLIHSLVDLEIANIVRLALKGQSFYAKLAKN